MMVECICGASKTSVVNGVALMASCATPPSGVILAFRNALITTPMPTTQPLGLAAFLMQRYEVSQL